ncbi:MAG TPA: hypothetical protein VGJ70_10560 [Solirubrobacteraceae bacterium]
MRGVLGSLAVAVALAGCGSDGGASEANSYVHAVNRAQSSFASNVRSLSGRIGTTSDAAADRRVLRSFDSAVGRVVGDLRQITPPDRVAGLHRRLVGQMDTYGRRVRRETAVLHSDDARRLVAVQQRLLVATNKVSDQVNATIDEINRRLKG